jgi:signal transduction histidine kinase
MTGLLSKDHPITETAVMEFRPFGKETDGTPIRDMGGVVTRANVEHLDDVVTQRHGQAAGRAAVEELVSALNARIPNRAYHVTPRFLNNPWNSYSTEFQAYMGRFCMDISEEPRFHFTMAKEKAIAPIIQVLGRPFSVSQIYRMSAYFCQRYAKDSFLVEAISVSQNSAVLRMTFSERMCRHLGPYRRSCAVQWCDGVKGYFCGVPEQFHNLAPATVKDLSCIAEGDEQCRWEVASSERTTRGRLWRIPMSLARHMVQDEIDHQERVMAKQVRALDMRHLELQESYLQQQQITAELQHRVDQLTFLHDAGLAFTSILDKDTLITTVLETIIQRLHYDRAMLTFFDRARCVAYDTRILGVSSEVAQWVRAMEISITDAEYVEGKVLLKGEAVLVHDLHAQGIELHPLNQKVAMMIQAHSLVSVPLKVKNQVLGALTVNRTTGHALGEDDLHLLRTLAGQVAIALDNTTAYRQIEELLAGLESKVKERTAELESANERLREVDRLKSTFVSHVSHELRTPLTSIKGFIENALAGLAGPLNDKLQTYLTRVKLNTERLTRMVADLLEQTRIEAGKPELLPREVNLRACAAEALEQLRPLAAAKGQSLELRSDEIKLFAWADEDRLIQIITNLVHNAIKYTPERGRIDVVVNFSHPQSATLCVRDTGEGISPEAIPKLFDPFYRGTQARRQEPKGLGLGLSIVKNLVELHGWTIMVESEVGKGSQFRVTLPIRPAAGSSADRPRRAVQRLLVIDDDPDICNFLTDRLRSLGYGVQTVMDGATAVHVLLSEAFDGIILDIEIPEIDGLELLRHVRQRDGWYRSS